MTQTLGYDESPNFLRTTDLERRPFSGYGHVYRKAQERCGLQGVYLLRDPRQGNSSEVPVVFYCIAENDTVARKVHQRIWNQGVVPFALVETPGTLRLYSGFRFDPDAANDHERGVLAVAHTFNEIADRIGAFHAQALDSGEVWERWGGELDLHKRVDPSLLDELERLGAELRKRGLEREPAHALIGKFVYLKYLRDRQVLSDRKLERWGLNVSSVFSHRATLEAFGELNSRLDGWLNGSVFPLPANAIRAEHLQLVASVFAGGASGGQLALDLAIYDFSLIPIETLSVIYEQFLHATEQGETSRGRRAGAYYTPIPLVNYMLTELESRRPLGEGMRVLDPACGSGAFLVQCYRALIEKRIASGRVRPTELRNLLTKHIFGVDSDPDACLVAEMSLILTLLDHLSPPDLESSPQFKLPVLRGNNIFCADFFDPDSEWAYKRRGLKVDWLVGNPPWREAKRTRRDDRHALEWIGRNAERCPTGGKQLAEAFVWRSLPMLDEDAVAALLLPAMTLFKMESTAFRARLFETVRAWSVTNFANFAYILFSGRSKAPALALFFEPRHTSTEGPAVDESILTFAPFLANQRVARARRTRHSKGTWSVVVNGAELRELRTTAIADGDFRPWKEAMWGSFRDTRLLTRVACRFPTLAEFGHASGLRIHEGFQLRQSGSESDAMPELVGRKRVDFSKLKHCGRIFTFPTNALSPIPADMANVRKGRGKLPWQVSVPPHLIVDASRRFAIYSDEFLAVPARKVEISGPDSTRDLLKALALYLSSDICRYHQFFITPEWGVRTSLATLDALREVPVPLDELDDAELSDWAAMHERLISEFSDGIAPSNETLLEVDDRVYRLLGLSTSERILVEDFVRWNMQLVQGKIPPDVVAPPDDTAIVAYLNILKNELDEFVGTDTGLRHDVHAVRGKGSVMLVVHLVRGNERSPSVLPAGEEAAAALEATRERLLRRHSQWLYFERSLKIYQDGAMHVFKPLETIHWTRRQALLDASEIVAETLGNQDA